MFDRDSYCQRYFMHKEASVGSALYSIGGKALQTAGNFIQNRLGGFLNTHFGNTGVANFGDKVVGWGNKLGRRSKAKIRLDNYAAKQKAGAAAAKAETAPAAAAVPAAETAPAAATPTAATPTAERPLGQRLLDRFPNRKTGLQRSTYMPPQHQRYSSTQISGPTTTIKPGLVGQVSVNNPTVTTSAGAPGMYYI